MLAHWSLPLRAEMWVNVMWANVMHTIKLSMTERVTAKSWPDSQRGATNCTAFCTQ